MTYRQTATVSAHQSHLRQGSLPELFPVLAEKDEASAWLEKKNPEILADWMLVTA